MAKWTRKMVLRDPRSDGILFWIAKFVRKLWAKGYRWPSVHFLSTTPYSQSGCRVVTKVSCYCRAPQINPNVQGFSPRVEPPREISRWHGRNLQTPPRKPQSWKQPLNGWKNERKAADFWSKGWTLWKPLSAAHEGHGRTEKKDLFGRTLSHQRGRSSVIWAIRYFPIFLKITKDTGTPSHCLTSSASYVSISARLTPTQQVSASSYGEWHA